ncbi:MAG: LysR family transcriptional regulator [Lentihominibacter sp.]
MSDLSTWRISTQQIQIFLKAVELKNFRKVADYYNFTPSTVSKTILTLETDLGIVLFYRNSHELVPTPAGQQLADDWRLLLGTINSSIIRAQKLQSEGKQRIILGFVDSSDEVDEAIRQAIRRFMEKCPEVQIVVEKHDMHRSVELLDAGMLDMVYTSAIEVPYINEHGLHWEKVKETLISAFVPGCNEMYERKSLEFSELKDCELVALDPIMHPSYTIWLNKICGRYGFTPNVAATFRTVRSLRFSLAMNKQIFIGENITSEWGGDDLKEFVFPDRSFTLLAWKNDDSQILTELREILKDILK